MIFLDFFIKECYTFCRFSHISSYYSFINNIKYREQNIKHIEGKDINSAYLYETLDITTIMFQTENSTKNWKCPTTYAD